MAAFVRYSLMTPMPGEWDRVRQLLDQMLEYQRGRDGFIAGFRLEPDEHDLHAFVGRFSVWESEEQANATALDHTQISLQSEIKRFVVDETHQERSFSAEVYEHRERG